MFHELAVPLSTFFNKLLSSSSFPSAWKLANVCPIFKKSDPSKPSNYRPISLLSCLGKLMERCVHKYLYNFVISNNLISSSQSGFIKGDSTVNQLTFLYNDVSKALDDGREVRAVFCDISKAFDRVWHKGLIHKLASSGIRGSLLDWFSSYLSNRRQKVVISNASSSVLPINAGVPQGSILGPLLFLIYINDIVNNIEANIRLFADDTSLYIIVDDPATSATILNRDLSSILAWSRLWLVSFNPSKTESLLFSRKRNKPAHPPLYFNNTPVSQVPNHKHLGVNLSEDTKWSTHVSTNINNAWKRIGMLKSLKFLISRSGLEKLYLSLIRPLLEYADVVWDNCSVELKKNNDIEAVQNEAARIVTGATKFCNIDKLLKDLNWETLAERRRKHRLTLFYKMKNQISPNYLSNLIPQQPDQPYHLRARTDVPNIYCNTQSYANSFLPLTIRQWNTLSPELRNSQSLGEFKRKLTVKRQIPSDRFNVGNRKNQINHARLRLGCSLLNFELHRRNLVPSPLCACGHNETVSHFLLQCPLYHDLRQIYFADLPCAPILNNLLFGNDHLSSSENSDLFLKVQGYIAATKRFDA